MQTRRELVSRRDFGGTSRAQGWLQDEKRLLGASQARLCKNLSRLVEVREGRQWHAMAAVSPSDTYSFAKLFSNTFIVVLTKMILHTAGAAAAK